MTEVNRRFINVSSFAFDRTCRSDTVLPPVIPLTAGGRVVGNTLEHRRCHHLPESDSTTPQFELVFPLAQVSP